MARDNVRKIGVRGAAMRPGETRPPIVQMPATSFSSISCNRLLMGKSDGRPALVLSPRIFNELTGRCIACPIARRDADWSFHVPPIPDSAESPSLAANARAGTRPQSAAFASWSHSQPLKAVRPGARSVVDAQNLNDISLQSIGDDERRL